eukprot:scaffold687_cov44-Attheya_sp.AAC.3
MQQGRNAFDLFPFLDRDGSVEVPARRLAATWHFFIGGHPDRRIDWLTDSLTINALMQLLMLKR